ncbi:MAG: hypothetical protein HFI20_03955 [Lachnospiraceae bacterium]|nr:hypothetical protein [Lachnospiraceae bacterium]MCI9306907.1 hypothetical protein [Lachnospiraceae bacterium]
MRRIAFLLFMMLSCCMLGGCSASSDEIRAAFPPAPSFVSPQTVVPDTLDINQSLILYDGTLYRHAGTALEEIRILDASRKVDISSLSITFGGTETSFSPESYTPSPLLWTIGKDTFGVPSFFYADMAPEYLKYTCVFAGQLEEQVQEASALVLPREQSPTFCGLIFDSQAVPLDAIALWGEPSVLWVALSGNSDIVSSYAYLWQFEGWYVGWYRDASNSDNDMLCISVSEDTAPKKWLSDLISALP